MVDATLPVLMMCLVMGSLQPVRSSEPQSMAAVLGKQSFYPMSWAMFMSSEEPDTFVSEFIHNASGVPSAHVSLAGMYQRISASQKFSLASFEAAKDPSDDIEKDLEKKSGLDRDEDAKVPHTSRSAPDEGLHAQRFNLRSVDVEAAVDSAVAPKMQPLPVDEPKSSATSWASSVSHRHQAGVRSLYNDMDDESAMRREANELGEPEESATSELARGLKNVAPKEVVKVLHQDDAFKRPVRTSGTKHLRKTVDKYAPEAQSMEGLAPIDATSLPKLYLHHGPAHGKSRAPEEEQQADHLRVSPDDMVTVSSPAPLEDPSPLKDSLATSLRRHVESEKTKEILARSKENMAKKNTQQPVVDAKPEEHEEAPDSSAMNSVHRHPSKKLKFKVRPEDIHYEEATTTTTTSAPTTTTSTMEKTQQRSVASVKDDWDVIFDANAFDGRLDADGVEVVLSKMTNMKNPSSWNWRRFDLDGDGKLSRHEFANAKQVAMRFTGKKSKK